ncbi:hypothetical protein KAU86_00330 [bacterium]|nr:hypothetical protein [bacterium]MCK4325665.1 hypothetical protein [bacterium]MCK4436376.1 hypothetical protein [bacterium]
MAVEQEAIEVIAFIPGYRIIGLVHLHRGGRLSDFINVGDKHFFPITKANIYSETRDELVYRAEIVNLNRKYVSLVFPTTSAEGKDGRKGEAG